MKRPIAALALPDVAPGTPATSPPVFMLVRPTELLVDEAYQRDLTDAGVRLIVRIVTGWDWRKFKAPSVSMTPEGPVVVDGQHTAIAAATHPLVDEIPVLVVEAVEQQDQARAFVGINTNRLGVTAPQLHHANLAAGDPAALAIDRACRAAGLTILRLPPSRAVYKPGETVAVGAIGGLVRRRGEGEAAGVLRILVEAGLGPVQATHVLAVEGLVFNDEFKAELLPGEIGRVITGMGIDAAEKEAKLFASTHCVPLWKALAATLFKNRKVARRRPAADEVAKPATGIPVAAAPVTPSRDAIVMRDDPSPSTSTRDIRPARGAWSPGRHLRRCSACDGTFEGGRTANVCAECAYEETEE